MFFSVVCGSSRLREFNFGMKSYELKSNKDGCTCTYVSVFKDSWNALICLRVSFYGRLVPMTAGKAGFLWGVRCWQVRRVTCDQRYEQLTDLFMSVTTADSTAQTATLLTHFNLCSRQPCPDSTTVHLHESVCFREKSFIYRVCLITCKLNKLKKLNRCFNIL